MRSQQVQVNKILVTASTFVIVFGIVGFHAHAGVPDLSVVCEPGAGSTSDNCHVESSVNPGVQNKQAPLFEGSVFPHYDLKPGDEFTRYMRVDNNRDEECYFSLLGGKINKDTEVLPGKYFSQELKVRISDGVKTIGPVSFYDLFNTTPLPLYLSTLAPDGEVGDYKNLSWLVTFDKNAGNEYQRAELTFDFDWHFECGEPLRTALFIGKTNDKIGIKQKPGSQVTFTLTVSTQEDPVYNVFVLDLPSDGFNYRGGSWTAFSNIRGDIKGTITPEPTYASPGKWLLGDMQSNEVVTLTYITDIDLDQKPGEYPDLAYTEGTLTPDTSSQRVLGNEPTGFFVGTSALVYLEDALDIEVDEKEVKSGEVLGISSLPGTGGDIRLSYMFGGLALFGICLFIFSFVSYRLSDISKNLL